MLSATELGITEAEHSALQVVRDGLASGRFTHVTFKGKEFAAGDCFNMNMACFDANCGTVACIGGWVAKTMGNNYVEADYYVFEGHSKALEPLYYPDIGYNDDGNPTNWDIITPAIAARAITTFLDSGDVDYPALMGIAR